MAIKATIFKLNLSISDMNRGYYQDHALTIARHPSETDLRMLVRIAVFALHAHEYLQFTKGLSDSDEPDLWQKSLTGDIDHWIELGQPTEKRIRQSCGKSALVSIYTYQKRAAQVWFEGIKSSLGRFDNLNVIQLELADEKVVERIIDRSMDLTCLIEDEHLLLNSPTENLSISLEILKKASR